MKLDDNIFLYLQEIYNGCLTVYMLQEYVNLFTLKIHFILQISYSFKTLSIYSL